ncbi:MAG: 2-oxoacid:acceptor oxidoreductase family protein, partial [Myxococcales bacterium]|nr:2-oxoacid:acceptor oxidoreductase family protein [Myxococcales bacterium]
SKKSGSMTVSHLRFGPREIRSTYLIGQAGFVACHQFGFVERVALLERARRGATLLLNSPWPAERVWEHLPGHLQRQILDLDIALWVIDADGLAGAIGMGRRINTIMQVCFFALSGVLPREVAIERIKGSIKKTYGKRGEAVVRKNVEAVDEALSHLHQVDLAGAVVSGHEPAPLDFAGAPAFVRDVTSVMMDNAGDTLPVSAMPVDGTFPVGTTKYEKRNIALEIPVWDESICIQCGKCAMVCPHTVIRAKVYPPEALADAPPTFKSVKARWRELGDMAYTLQVAPEDCTACGLCVEVCPVKNKAEVRLKAVNLAPQAPIRDAEKANWDFFQALPDLDRGLVDPQKVKDVQLLEPLFEFPGACSGCGETPYLKLATQLFGDRMVVANATGCSSIYGGNLP